MWINKEDYQRLKNRVLELEAAKDRFEHNMCEVQRDGKIMFYNGMMILSPERMEELARQMGTQKICDLCIHKDVCRFGYSVSDDCEHYMKG